MWANSSVTIDSKKATWTSIILIVLTTIVLGLPTLVYPFGQDQSEYAWIAVSTLKDDVSYSDIFNVKPPFTHLLHQASLVLFGQAMTSIRILDLCWQAITALLIFMIARQIKFSHTASLLAAVLYLFSYYKLNFWMTAQTDGFLTLPIAAAVLLFLQAQQRNQPLLFAASGLAVGIGILFKYPIGILVVLFSILMVTKKKRDSFVPVLSMGAGLLLILILNGLIMFLRENLADFLWIQFTYIPKYSTISLQHPDFVRILAFIFLVILLPSIPGWYGFFLRDHDSRSNSMSVIVLWWVAAVTHCVIQNKFYAYHAIPIFAPVALMTSYLNQDVVYKRSRIQLVLRVFGLAMIVIPFFQTNTLQNYIRLWNVATQKIFLQDAYNDKVFNENGHSYQAEAAVSRYINSNTRQDDRIFVWGFNPSIYFLSQRRNATRFIYNFTLYGPNASPDLRQEFISEIQEQKPAYVVIVKNDAIFHVSATTEDSWTAFITFDEFHHFVLENYHLETTIEDFVLYRLDS